MIADCGANIAIGCAGEAGGLAGSLAERICAGKPLDGDSDISYIRVGIRNPKGVTPMSLQENSTAIAEFILANGVTRCPTVCLVPTYGSVSLADRLALRRRAEQREASRRQRAREAWLRSLGWNHGCMIEQRPNGPALPRRGQAPAATAATLGRAGSSDLAPWSTAS
jgi:hypothetical protein